MTADGSVTSWIRLLRDGDQAAAQPLWERYFSQLEALARYRLHGRTLGVADAEDVALSAMDSLCRGLERGRYPDLGDRDDLWRLLLVITARKAAHLIRDEQRLKRGGRRAADVAAQGPLSQGSVAVDQIIGHEPTPEFAALVAEESERLMKLLPHADLQQVARSKLEGYTNREIAEQLQCAPRTVDRKLSVIRHLWEHQAGL